MAIEIRPAQALKLLHDFSYALVTDRQPDLSPRQLTILLTIYLDPPPHNVRGLARKLKVTKPVLTRALVRSEKVRNKTAAGTRSAATSTSYGPAAIQSALTGTPLLAT